VHSAQCNFDSRSDTLQIGGARRTLGFIVQVWNFFADLKHTYRQEKGMCKVLRSAYFGGVYSAMEGLRLGPPKWKSQHRRNKT
jgi:hypothetical protein